MINRGEPQTQPRSGSGKRCKQASSVDFPFRDAVTFYTDTPELIYLTALFIFLDDASMIDIRCS
jgi:hypothetical protein